MPDASEPHNTGAEPSVASRNAPATGHEPHRHAKHRLFVGLGAVALVGVAGYVWATWGDTIKDACFGDNGACTVEIEGLKQNTEGGYELPETDTY